MGPDEEKKLRQLLLLKRKLPEPDWNLFARATKKFSVIRESMPSISTQAREQMKKSMTKQNAKTSTSREKRQRRQEMES